MPDISKCANEKCEKSSTCYRFLAVDSPYWQAYIDASPNDDGNCSMYWEVKEK